jgi:PKD repeat protein
VRGFVPHPVTDGITSIGVDFQRPLLSMRSPAVDLTLGSGADDILAAVWGQQGAGNVVLISDVSLWGNATDRSIDFGDNRLLLLNILAFITSHTAIPPPNLPPAISELPNQVILEDAASAALTFTVGDAGTPAKDLAINASSSNTNLVGATNMVLAGSNNSRSLKIRPLPDQFGESQITLTVTDKAGLSASTAFMLTVLSVNDPPTFMKGPDVIVNQNSGRYFALWATNISPGPTNEAGQMVSFRVTGANSNLFAASPFVDTQGRLTFTPATNAFGVAALTIVAKDDGGTARGGIDTSAPKTFRITVQKVTPDTILEGQVTDAVNGTPVANASIEIGASVASTDETGEYRLTNLVVRPIHADFNAGNRTGPAPLTVPFYNASTDAASELTATRDGYLSYTNSRVDLREGATTRLNFSLSPTNLAGLRLVLNWGATPRDLDAYLLTPKIQGINYEVSYSHTYRGNIGNPPYAQLDQDRTDGFGPETITLARLLPGIYRFFVHNYTADQGNTGELTDSSATVQIYTGTGLERTIRVPNTGTGEYWDVCTFDGSTGAITERNILTATEPAYDDLSSTNGTATPEPTNSLTARYVWDFGDGTTSTNENPLKVYRMPGQFDVTLRIETPDGRQDTEVKPAFIVVESQSPRLTLLPSGDQAVIAWTTDQTSYVLESAADLAAPFWETAPEEPIVDQGTNFSVTISLTATRFFRLRQALP